MIRADPENFDRMCASDNCVFRNGVFPMPIFWGGVILLSEINNFEFSGGGGVQDNYYLSIF